MATNDCIVHSRKNVSNFHATVNQFRRENKFSHNVYQELSKRCCSCNGKTGLNGIDLNILINICEEIVSEQSIKPKSSYDLTLSFEPETDSRERRTRIGRFLGRKSENFNVLRDKYNILLYIKKNSPIRKVLKREKFEGQERDNPNELQVVVRRKDKLMTDTIPIGKIKEEINKQWEEASEIRYIQKQYTFDQNQFQFVFLSFESSLSLEERHDIMGRFIGKKGENLRHLEDQYNIRLHIINNQSSNRKYFEKLIAVRENNPDIVYLFITKKDKSMTNEIPIEEVKEQIIQKWKQAIIEPSDDELFHVLSFSYESKRFSLKFGRKIGCFIGKYGQHLRDLQEKYNVNIQIINRFSRKKLQRKLAKIQDIDKVNKLYLLITNKNKSTTNTIPIDKIEQDLIELWTNEKQTTNVNNSQPWKLNSEPIEFSFDSARFANATPQKQKQMLGERLFPLVQQMQPELAGKITGMLLEIDNTELLHMLESRESLEAKVEEGFAVIQAHLAK